MEIEIFTPTYNLERQYSKLLIKHIGSFRAFLDYSLKGADVETINQSLGSISMHFVNNMYGMMYKLFLKNTYKTTNELSFYMKSIFNKKGLPPNTLIKYGELLKHRDSIKKEFEMMKEHNKYEKTDAIPYKLFQQFLEDNVALVKDVDSQLRNNIIRVIETQYRLGTTQSVAIDLIRKALMAGGSPFDIAINRAKKIAIDQMNKLRSSIDMYNQREILGISKYVWETRLDEKVRKTHKPMQGTICYWDDPTVCMKNGKVVTKDSIGGINLHAGMDINCRCFSVPYIE